MSAVILTLAGPTASGKTALSLELAERLDAEIISADSRQVYRELTIGTAKPSPEECARVPHHFVDERSLDEPFSAGAFADEANARIRAILERGRTPLVVGGSTLYLHALQQGLADIPDVAPEVRSRLMQRLDEEGAHALFEELRKVDPASAERTDPSKTHRIVRALEVYHGTGAPLSHYHRNQPEPPFDYHTVVLHRERGALYCRINRRVERMLEAGLLDEVQSLLDRELDLSRGPLKTIGYREPIAHLRGEIDHDEMVRLIKRNTRRYAKRQLTWLRRYPEYQWIDADTSADRLISLFRGRSSVFDEETRDVS